MGSTPRARKLVAVALAVLAANGVSSLAHADGTITGHGRFERLKGAPALGYAELYESNLFFCPDGGTTIGPSARLGAPAGQAPRGDGYYSLRVPAGSWSILVNQPLFFVRPKVVSGVVVEDNRTKTVHVELPIAYSTYFTDTWTVFENVWTQTFVADGTSITGVSWRLAGTNATDIEVAVLEEDAARPNPSQWPLVSALARRSDTVAAITDNWVRWRSGEVPTVPGRRYAIRLTGTSGGDRKFAVFKRDSDASSYVAGAAYNPAGAAQSFDLNVTIFSDNDGTAVLLNKTTEGLGDLRDGYYGGRWGQTFRATTGTSLAAVDVWAAGADRQWDLDFRFTVHRGGPTGQQVGPAKTTKAAFQAFGAGLHGVSYNPGEVPLVAGETYYIEFTNSPGFNPYVMNDARDAYAGGAAYQDRALKDGGTVDLSMTIVVWDEAAGGTVSGRVRDAVSQQGVSGATVLLVELGRSARTEADGSYELVNVPPGTYTARVSKTGYDTATRAGVVVELDETTTVDVSLQPQDCGFEFRNGGFESGLTGWSRYGDARDRVVDTAGGGWFGGIVAQEGSKLHGNEINGCCLNGGLYQRFCAVPGHRIRVSAWSNIYWISGSSDDARNRVGVDPDGGTDPGGLVTWSAVHRQPQSSTEGWRRIVVEAVATGPVMTVFLDFAQRNASGNVWRINCFDAVEIEDLDASVEPTFLRGDCDASDARDISDPVYLLDFLFREPRVITCDDACDMNDDGGKDVSDAVFLLAYLFQGGPPPPEPHTGCGPDSSDDPLGCETPTCESP